MRQADGSVVRELSISPPSRRGNLHPGWDAPGDLNCPMGLCLNPDESVLAVADMQNYRILLIPLDDGGECVDISLEGKPSDVAFTKDGQQLVIATPYSKEAHVLDVESGNPVQRISWEVSGCLKLPDEDFEIWRKRDLAGTDQTRPGEVRAVAVDGAGNIVSADERGLQVRSLEGTLLHSLPDPGEFQGRCAGLAVDRASGRIAAASNSCSQRVAPVFVWQTEDMTAADDAVDVHGRGKGKSKGKGKPAIKGKGKGK